MIWSSLYFFFQISIFKCDEIKFQNLNIKQLFSKFLKHIQLNSLISVRCLMSSSETHLISSTCHFTVKSWWISCYVTDMICSLLVQIMYNIGIIIIIIALDNAPYKMLHKLKSACSIRKNQLWTSACSSVSQKSRDQLSDPSIQQATHSNSWDQQQQGSQTQIMCNEIPTEYNY